MATGHVPVALCLLLRAFAHVDCVLQHRALLVIPARELLRAGVKRKAQIEHTREDAGGKENKGEKKEEMQQKVV
jgi:hypothetical protein